nr:type VI secretion system lipoprotein TssJ [Halorhodospira halochloris]
MTVIWFLGCRGLLKDAIVSYALAVLWRAWSREGCHECSRGLLSESSGARVAAKIVGAVLLLSIISSTFMLGGCAPHINIKLDAAADINPGPQGEPLSLLLRIYQLEGKEQLSKASYVDLLDDDSSVLASNLVDRYEVILRPEENKEVRLPMADQANYLGLVAFFRDPVTEYWQQIEKLPQRLFGKRRSKRIKMMVRDNSLFFYDREYDDKEHKHGKLASD